MARRVVGMDPSDVASLIIKQLKMHDGPAAISVLQGSDRESSHLLLTPVVKNGRCSFDVRVSPYFTQLRKAEGVNFEDVGVAAEFLASHGRSIFRGNNVVSLRFVDTQHPREGEAHMNIDLTRGSEGLVSALRTLVKMRHLQGDPWESDA